LEQAGLVTFFVSPKESFGQDKESDTDSSINNNHRIKIEMNRLSKEL